jgi:hypothetical protein
MEYQKLRFLSDSLSKISIGFEREEMISEVECSFYEFDLRLKVGTS